ncbi:MAG: hypothetical protein JKY00_03790 [Roseicyclus sp.]|nr:hypothetical protein [Roseicyclus sp.]
MSVTVPERSRSIIASNSAKFSAGRGPGLGRHHVGERQGKHWKCKRGGTDEIFVSGDNITVSPGMGCEIRPATSPSINWRTVLGMVRLLPPLTRAKALFNSGERRISMLSVFFDIGMASGMIGGWDGGVVRQF